MATPKKKPSSKPGDEKKGDYSEELKKLDAYSLHHTAPRMHGTAAGHPGLPVYPYGFHGKQPGGPSMKRPGNGEGSSKPVTKETDTSSISDTLGRLARLTTEIAVNGLSQLNAMLAAQAPSAPAAPLGYHHDTHACCCGEGDHFGYHPQIHHHGSHHDWHHCGCNEPAIGNYHCCNPGVFGC